MHMNFLTNKLLKLAFSSALFVFFFSASASFAQNQDPVVELQTTKGNIYIRVYRGLVPRTSTNFLDLVNRGFYSGTVFHRIENWCIQGGAHGNPNGGFIDPNTGRKRCIPLEINRRLKHSSAGVVAMARNSRPNSASSQFYILKAPMRQLDGQYAIFGRVLQGGRAVMSMRRGDKIISARVVQEGSSNNNNQSNNRRNQSNKRPNGPVEKFVPPTDIPDSGF